MAEGEKSIEIASEPVEEVKCSKCGCEIDVAGLEPFLRVECPDCGHVEIVPVKFATFLLLDLVGTGGMGGVYAAKDEALGRLVAIKVMLKALGDDAAFVDGFRKEAQAVAKLNHPHIAQIYSFGQVHGQPYIVMELVPGERLDKMIESGRPIDQGLVMRVGMEVAEGLAAAEEEGLIHGDIKPENILLDEKMHAKLVDFGLASYVNQAAGDGIWGTPYYIAPEKVKRQKADARSDMYSLGATLYHALAGRPPFEGDSPVDVVKARLKAPPRPVHDYRPKIDQHAESIVMRMLDIQPAKRHPTYASLISDLRKSANALCGKRRGFGKGG
ncbi:protein kinase, partial [Verrucomicrobiota bacterium]